LNIIRPWASWSVATLTLAAVGVALGGCGAAQEAPRPAPAKVVWGGSGEAEPALTDGEATKTTSAKPARAAAEPTRPPPAPPAEPGSEASGAGEIDLDKLAAAPAPSAATPAAADDASADTQRVLDAAKQRVSASDTTDGEPSGKATGKSKGKTNASKKGSSKKRAAATKSGSSKDPAAEPSEPSKPAAPAESASAAPAYSGSDPCKTTRFSVPRVREACATGGRRGAKSVMKDAIQKAIAAGGSLRCTSCHQNQVDYSLRPDAVAQLRHWLDT
jgi:hypothetical protein